MLKKQLLSSFNIQEEELRKTLLLTTHIFLIITALLVIKPTINSLFLSELTSSALPLGYVLTAIFAVVGSYFYNKRVEKKAFNRIVEGTLIGSIASLVLFGVAFKLDLIHGFLLYVPYVWIAIFGLLTASQFWILANLVYNIRVAKRVFGFIGSGAILGGIVGGYITSFLTLFLNVEDLLFVAAFFISICIPIVRYVWKNDIVPLNTFQKAIRAEQEAKKPFKLIQQSKLLTLIAIVISISVVVAKLVDYQYSYYASKLIADPEELASFFGFWFSTLSVVSLFIQLFVTKRVVGIFGVGTSLLWLPVGVLFGTLLLVLVPQLWVIVLIKIVEGALKNSVNKSATELLSIPVPIEIKKRTKTFIDVVVDSIATGIAGFLLIFFINGLDIHPVYISLIIAFFISVWIFFIFKLRKEYVNSFKDLFTPTDFLKEAKPRKNPSLRSISSAVRTVFNTGDETQVLLMLTKTLEAKEELFFHDIKKLLHYPSATVRTRAIENLYHLKSLNLSQEMEDLIHDEDQHVTTAAFRYLIKFYQGDLVVFFDTYLHHTDETIANGALIGLSIELRNYKDLQERFNFHAVLKAYIQQFEELTAPSTKQHKLSAILEAIGNSRAKFYYPFIVNHLNHSATAIVNPAIKGAGLSLDPEFIPLIVEKLKDQNTRKIAVDALFGYGTLMIQTLVKKTIAGEFSVEAAKFVPQVIGKFTTQNAITGLIQLIDECEHSIKIQAIYYLTQLKWNHPHLVIKERVIIDKILDECELYQQTLSVFHSQIIILQEKDERITANTAEIDARNNLITVLESRMDRQLERIFKFLGVKFPPQEIDAVLNIILSGREEQRLHAIEFLDNILDIQLKKELIPIAESTMIEVISKENLTKLNIKVLTEKACFTILLNLNDDKIKMAVLQLIDLINNATHIPLIETLLKQNETNRVSAKANAIITRLSNAEPL